MIDTQQVRQSLLQDRAVVDAIRRRAHQISLERGYSTPQHMADDWFRAENEVLNKLIEEEIKRRQKMNAAISEGAMAEEAVPAVTLPPSVAQRLAAQAATTPARKPAARRKKAAAPDAGDAVAVSPPANMAAPTEDAADKPKRTRKAKAADDVKASPATVAEAAPTAPTKRKTAKASRKKTP